MHVSACAADEVRDLIKKGYATTLRDENKKFQTKGIDMDTMPKAELTAPHSNEKSLGGVSRLDPLDGLENEKQKAFLLAYRQCGTIAKAVESSSVAKSNHYYWLEQDARYRRAFQYSRNLICSHIEEGLVDRLANGWDEPVFQGGALVGHRRKFDNANAIAYLDRHDADFRKNKGRTEVNIQNNVEGGARVRITLPHNGRDPLPESKKEKPEIEKK